MLDFFNIQNWEWRRHWLIDAPLINTDVKFLEDRSNKAIKHIRIEYKKDASDMDELIVEMLLALIFVFPLFK